MGLLAVGLVVFGCTVRADPRTRRSPRRQPDEPATRPLLPVHVGDRILRPVPDRRLPGTARQEPEADAQHARGDQHCRPPPHAILRSTSCPCPLRLPVLVVLADLVPKFCAGPAEDLRPHIGGEGDANRRPGTMTIRHPAAGTFQAWRHAHDVARAAGARSAGPRRDRQGRSAAALPCPHANRTRTSGRPPVTASVGAETDREADDGNDDRGDDGDDALTHGLRIGSSPRRLNGKRAEMP